MLPGREVLSLWSTKGTMPSHQIVGITLILTLMIGSVRRSWYIGVMLFLYSLYVFTLGELETLGRLESPPPHVSMYSHLQCGLSRHTQDYKGFHCKGKSNSLLAGNPDCIGKSCLQSQQALDLIEPSTPFLFDVLLCKVLGLPWWLRG